MDKYKNGKIYTLRSFQTDDIYIGSTIEKLCSRMSKHRHEYKIWKKGKYHYVSSFNILQYEDAYIELLEEYPCNNKMELHKKEGEYIRSMDCVNKMVAGRTRKDYEKERNKTIHRKEYKKEYQKEYRKNISKITCICGKTLTKQHKARHEKSKKHIKYIEDNNNNNIDN